MKLRWSYTNFLLTEKIFVLVLRPAEIAVIVLTFAEYSIQPLMPVLGMTDMSFDDQQKVIKLIALLGLGTILCSRTSLKNRDGTNSVFVY